MKALVACGIAPLYREASAQSEHIDEALFGMEVETLLWYGPWVKIQTPYRYEGYVSASCLVFDELRIAEWAALPHRMVARPWADIQKEPKVQAETLASVAMGSLAALRAPAETGQWVPVLLPDGREGFAIRNHLGPLPLPWREQGEGEFREGILRAARGYLGTQYRWGGKTHQGIDCSGLASMSYMLNGSYIYRDAKILPGYDIHEIKGKDIKKGDLIFFPGHVAIYMGDRRFIHSTSYAGTEGVGICGMEPGSEGYRGDLMAIISAYGSLF
ncbi:MAG: C40 family peptidase [Treponema sp.]|jgi:cell wall-associated NlpC family hydrolase|nr:C40 family peptidase [Treponema sp.]